MLKNILIITLMFLTNSVFACATHNQAEEGKTLSPLASSNYEYPDEWWKPVPESDLASWEIGPQGADRNKNEVILSKRNDLGMLSNFYAAPFTFQGIHYGSVEGLWQSLKYPENAQDPRNSPEVTWAYSRSQVEMMTAFEAKAAGDLASKNMAKLKIKWITFKGEKIDYKGTEQRKHYELIFNATVQKVVQNPNVRNLLMRTGDLKLMPDHHQEPNSPPAYAYYDIAMKIRDALRAGQEPKP